MNDIKATLVEKERLAWIDGKIREAEFYDAILLHIIALEEEINDRDRELEGLTNGADPREKS